MKEAERPVDLDLTKISGTVAYSQVYDMMMDPDSYPGRKVRMKGNFSYFQDPETNQEYFAAVIADATACCAQGIEFEWKGAHTYPRDYPPLDADITVTGIFSPYFEGDYYVSSAGGRRIGLAGMFQFPPPCEGAYTSGRRYSLALSSFQCIY